MTVDQIKASLPESALTSIGDLPYPKVGSGKVREIYDLGENLLIIASDRLSAFDVILPQGIPGKGILLTQLSLWWFRRTEDIIGNHLVPGHGDALAGALSGHEALIPRSMLVRKLKPLPVEAVARGYLAGSGWKDYRATGALFGQPLPAGLVESAQLPQPLFTPTTKAQSGHDEPISLAECESILGPTLHRKVMDTSLELFRRGTDVAARAGLILADTKFEFGTDANGDAVLIDEVLTPDSSRYWPARDYEPGRPQHAYDKQYVRDYLETLDWDKTPPGPELPDAVITQTQARYLEALEKMMG